MPGTIGGLPRAQLPLTGNDLIELEQNGRSVKTAIDTILDPVNPIFSQLILTNSDAPDLVDTITALNLGSVDPTASPHLEFGPAQVQAKSNETTATTLDLNTLGGNIQIGDATEGNILVDDTGDIQLSRTGGFLKFSTQSGGVTIFRDNNSDFTSLNQQYRNADLTLKASVGFAGGQSFEIRNYIEGGNVSLVATETGGSSRNILVGDPDAGTTLRGDTSLRLEVGSTELAMTATVNSTVALYHDNIATAETLATTQGGFRINNTLTGVGFERALTISDLGEGIPSLAFKAADTARASTTTVTSDPDLIVVLPSGGFYSFELYLRWTNGSGDADLKFDFNLSDGSFTTSSLQLITAGGTVDSLNITTDTVVNIAASSSGLIQITGSIDVFAIAATTLQFRWAQNVSNAVATTLRSTSWMRVSRLGDT